MIPTGTSKRQKYRREQTVALRFHNIIFHRQKDNETSCCGIEIIAPAGIIRSRAPQCATHDPPTLPFRPKAYKVGLCFCHHLPAGLYTSTKCRLLMTEGSLSFKVSIRKAQKQYLQKNHSNREQFVVKSEYFKVSVSALTVSNFKLWLQFSCHFRKPC